MARRKVIAYGRMLVSTHPPSVARQPRSRVIYGQFPHLPCRFFISLQEHIIDGGVDGRGAGWTNRRATPESSIGSNAGTVDHVDSYYAASANGSPVRSPLNDAIDVDICVVGAGFSGLSTAVHLAEQGHSVVMLEAARVGWGASGRNGGQIVNGLNASLDTIESRYGTDKARFVGSMVQEGAGIIRRLISDYNIACDLKPRNLYVAFNASQMKVLETKQRQWREHGMDDHEMLDAEALRRHVDSRLYCGGMLDHSGGHLHPLNLALGEAAALESLGGIVHEQSPVTHIENIDGEPVVHTAGGTVRPRQLVLCGNAYLGGVVPELEIRIMPVSTQMVATEPLSESMASELLPSDSCVEDVRYILDYYRLSADRRLLFGGGTVYGGTDPHDVRAKLRPHLEKVFPQLRGIAIDHAWSGNFALSFSRVPQLGQLGRNTWFAMGYSGHGVTGSHLFGRILAEAIDGERSRFDTFAALPWYPFPGGQRLRAPYSTVGSWWYAMRDAVGL